MTPKRGRPYGAPKLAELQVGELYFTADDEATKRAATTARNLGRKYGTKFEIEQQDGGVRYRRVA